VRTGELSAAQETRVTATIAELGNETDKIRDEFIGPSLGDELRRKALAALGVALAAQMLYLAIRFRWTFGVASVVAMLHDVLVLVGVFAWLGKTVDAVFLAALLTVIGYSVNDSVVVFDRVRELRRANGAAPFARTTNTAVLQTVPRTVNTGMGALFILIALACLGGDTLTDFALALLIGIVVGTWSTVFTAAPLAIELEARRGARTPRAEAPDDAPGKRGGARPREGMGTR
jgi:SecD/SecF fusion protein